MEYNGSGLVAVGVFIALLFNIAPQPNRSTKAQNLHFCPYCYKPLLAEVAVNLQGFISKFKKMDFIKVKDENGLELTVTTDHPQDYDPIMGGMDTSPNWEEYLSDYKDEFKPHLKLIKKAIEDLGWVGETADRKANETCFLFSDKTALGFSWRAWGDLMSAIVGKNEGYMAYYM